MQSFVIHIMDRFGYPGIFFLILIENLFPPIPSEVILTFGGFMTTYTELTPVRVILSATFGSVLGAVILYYAGRLLSRQAFERILDGKLGKTLRFEKEDVKDAGKRFNKKGRTAVFLCRCVPIMRSLISIPAGMAHMNMISFLILTTAGSLVWNTVLITAGAAAGASWEKISHVTHSYSNLTVLLLGTAVWFLISLYFKKKKLKE